MIAVIDVDAIPYGISDCEKTRTIGCCFRNIYVVQVVHCVQASKLFINIHRL